MSNKRKDDLSNLPRSPCIDQNLADIEAYYRKAQAGDIAAVRHTQGHILRYEILSIKDVNPKIGRIYLNLGAFYMKSGKMYSAPTGQTRLVVPTEKVVAWAKEHPLGKMGYTTLRSEDLPRL